jgi:multidrug transporter EmrE-like cation transporter
MKDGYTMFAMILVLICIMAGAFGQISLKQGMSGLNKINSIDDLLNLKLLFSILENKYIILGIILYGFALILWLAAMSTLDVSFMYPLLSLAYVVVAIFAVVFLGEVITASRWLGIVLVIVGSILIVAS